MITKSFLAGAMNYAQYIHLLEKLLAEGKTTGLNQSQEYLDYAKINLQRMARIEKTAVLSDDLKDKLNSLKIHYTWLVITEGWCGDAAQNLPPIFLMAMACSKIDLKLVLRDDNLDLMDKYLTKGNRSIPKLICFNTESLEELFVWGPRPAALQAMVEEMIKNGIAKPERGLEIQKWYNADKTQSLQKELLALIDQSLH